MSLFRIVPEEDMEVLRKYLSEPLVILMPESLVDSLPLDEAFIVRDAEGVINFATDDATVWVDIVEDENHALLTDLLGGEEY